MTRLFMYSDSNLGPLQNNHRHKFAINHAIGIYPKNAIYTMIPKNACSTMRTAIAVANGCIRDEGFKGWIHDNNASFPVDMQLAQRAEFTFVILRCPFRRLYSAFLDKIVGSDLQAWKLYAATNYQTHPHDISFREFVNALKDPRVISCDPHWRPQVDFLLYREYDRYYSIEQFREAELEIEKCAGIRMPRTRDLFGHSLHTLREVEGEFADVCAFDLLAQRRIGLVPDITSLYAKDIIEDVASIYNEDIKHYLEHFGSNNISFDVL